MIIERLIKIVVFERCYGNQIRTIASTKMEIFCGGKALNQSIAVGRLGAANSIPKLQEVEA